MGFQSDSTRSNPTPPQKKKAVFVIALAGLVDAGFSGDWQARGYLSDAAAETARTACFAAAAAHVALTAAAGFIAQAKGEGLAAAAITLAVRKKRAGRMGRGRKARDDDRDNVSYRYILLYVCSRAEHPQHGCFVFFGGRAPAVWFIR